MKLVGLDFNATRLYAVAGAPGAAPRPLILEGDQPTLPVALSLEHRQPQVGLAGVNLCRRLPHLSCINMPAWLGEPREWRAGRHRLDAAKALALVFDRLQPPLAGCKGCVTVVPDYLNPTQIGLLLPLLERTKVPQLASVVSPLAAVQAAYAEQSWSGLTLVLDADEHALSFAVVSVEKDQARILEQKATVALGLRAWKEAMLNAIADRCVRHSRRDPRDSASAEQALYEQLDQALEPWRRGQRVELIVQAAPWFQNLVLLPEEASGFCQRLVRGVREEMRYLVEVFASSLRAIVLTDAVARLPGLEPSLRAYLRESPALAAMPLEEPRGSRLRNGMAREVLVLPADGLARAAWLLSRRCQDKELARGHFDSVLALQPPTTSLDGGRAARDRQNLGSSA